MQRLASQIIGEPVAVWARQRHDAGKSWRLIAEELAATSRGKVIVPHQTIYQWATANRGATTTDEPEPTADAGS